jgi:hypothetical protein
MINVSFSFTADTFTDFIVQLLVDNPDFTVFPFRYQYRRWTFVIEQHPRINVGLV